MEIVREKKVKKVKLSDKEREVIIEWLSQCSMFGLFPNLLVPTLEKEDTFDIDCDDDGIFYIPYSDGIGRYSISMKSLSKAIKYREDGNPFSLTCSIELSP